MGYSSLFERRQRAVDVFGLPYDGLALGSTIYAGPSLCLCEQCDDCFWFSRYSLLARKRFSTSSQNRRTLTNADLVLGLFPVTDQNGADLIDVGSDGRPRAIVIKPERSELHYAWINALWTPVFTAFMHEYVTARKPKAALTDMKNRIYPKQECHLGHVIQAGIEHGLSISCVQFPNGSYVDIGTVDNLYATVKSE